MYWFSGSTITNSGTDWNSQSVTTTLNSRGITFTGSNSKSVSIGSAGITISQGTGGSQGIVIALGAQLTTITGSAVTSGSGSFGSLAATAMTISGANVATQSYVTSQNYLAAASSGKKMVCGVSTFSSGSRTISSCHLSILRLRCWAELQRLPIRAATLAAL